MKDEKELNPLSCFPQKNEKNKIRGEKDERKITNDFIDGDVYDGGFGGGFGAEYLHEANRRNDENLYPQRDGQSLYRKLR